MNLLAVTSSQESPFHLSWESDLSWEFQKWFSPILKWRWWFRVQRGCQGLGSIVNKNYTEFVAFLDSFTTHDVVCWMIHEKWNQVIRLLDWRHTTLTLDNCPIQAHNSACGHPEITWLAQAIFIAERFLSSYQYKRWFWLLNEIMVLDANIWWLADRGMYNWDAIKAQQKDIVWKMHWYIQTLVAALKQRAI